MRRVDNEYLSVVTTECGDMVANLCRLVSDFRNSMPKEFAPGVFAQQKEKLTELLVPFGLKFGDTNGGFASGTKWYNEDKTLWVSWNTYWNHFIVRVYKEGAEFHYEIYSNEDIDRIEREFAEIRGGKKL